MALQPEIHAWRAAGTQPNFVCNADHAYVSWHSKVLHPMVSEHANSLQACLYAGAAKLSSQCLQCKLLAFCRANFEALWLRRMKCK